MSTRMYSLRIRKNTNTFWWKKTHYLELCSLINKFLTSGLNPVRTYNICYCAELENISMLSGWKKKSALSSQTILIKCQA